jgi:hypothetical protein
MLRTIFTNTLSFCLRQQCATRVRPFYHSYSQCINGTTLRVKNVNQIDYTDKKLYSVKKGGKGFYLLRVI